MKKTVIIGFIMICVSSTAMAHRYDYADEMAYREIANINAQEQADVMHELREGDFREAQQIMQYDEVLKNQVRQQEAMYDRARGFNRFNYGYADYPGW
ncbi:MAG TPA: hypothetical protein VIF37_09160 [Methylobacter sp.]|jgi:hypothetical protein